MLYKVFKKLEQGPQVPQVVCAESSATHTFCTHTCNHRISPCAFGKAETS